jgi:hypothetical protein
MAGLSRLRAETSGLVEYADNLRRGTMASKATPFFERLWPGMTVGKLTNPNGNRASSRIGLRLAGLLG